MRTLVYCNGRFVPKRCKISVFDAVIYGELRHCDHMTVTSPKSALSCLRENCVQLGLDLPLDEKAFRVHSRS